MDFIMAAHASVGAFVVCAGALALFVKKGSTTHRWAGRLFVIALLLMAPIVLLGRWYATDTISALGILFTLFMLYLVMSAVSTIGKPGRRIDWWDFALPVVALGVVVAGATMGINAYDTPTEAPGAPPKEAYFFFAGLALLTLCLDLNNLRLGGVQGKHRIVRHVWRMTCVLFFSTSTLFTGPGAIVFPEWIRGSFALLAPQALILIMSSYWIYRTLFSTSQRKFNDDQFDGSR